MPISRKEMQDLVSRYDKDRICIGVLGSHSALDVLDGAKDEGFRTLVVCQRGRELPYLRFKRVVDKIIILDKFKDIVKPEVQEKLIKENVIFVPNRSFAVYVGYDAIENEFAVPIFGNRFLLRWEERKGEKNYYKLLDEAGIRRPKVYSSPDEIDGPVIVKLPEAKRRVERGFFIARDRKDFEEKVNRLLKENIIDEESLKEMVIEELVLGAHFNLNYFYSVVRREVELDSIDRRIQSNLDGIMRLPAREQLELDPSLRLIEVGHTPATIRESLLTKVFKLGDAFVAVARKLEPPGVIGPFTLQAMVTPDLELVVYDVAPRIGGGTNIYMCIGSQYSKLYHGEPLSTGRRIAREIRWAIEKNMLEELVT